jgi:hypothetical protein
MVRALKAGQNVNRSMNCINKEINFNAIPPPFHFVYGCIRSFCNSRPHFNFVYAGVSFGENAERSNFETKFFRVAVQRTPKSHRTINSVLFVQASVHVYVALKINICI